MKRIKFHKVLRGIFTYNMSNTLIYVPNPYYKRLSLDLSNTDYHPYVRQFVVPNYRAKVQYCHLTNVVYNTLAPMYRASSIKDLYS